MGAWGKGSFENDTGLDFINSILNIKSIEKLIYKKNLEHHNYDELRITAEILIHLHKINNLWVDKKIINGLINGLEVAIRDTSWHNTWYSKQDATDIIKQLKSFVKKLEKLDGY